MNPFPPLPQVLRKEKEALAKKQRLVEQGLAAVNADMAEFQKEKQGRLNQVEVVVALRMHQVGVGKGGRCGGGSTAGGGAWRTQGEVVGGFCFRADVGGSGKAAAVGTVVLRMCGPH